MPTTEPKRRDTHGSGHAARIDPPGIPSPGDDDNDEEDDEKFVWEWEDSSLYTPVVHPFTREANEG